MSGLCPYVCFNKTEYGYCRSTVCTNKSVIEYLTNRGCNTQFTYGLDSKCYRVPCTHCGGVGYITPNTTSVSPVQCPVCMGVGDVVYYANVETVAEPVYDLCKDNAMCCDDDCKKCAQRVYKAYMKERQKNNG
jgi:hypothetical protein